MNLNPLKLLLICLGPWFFLQPAALGLDQPPGKIQAPAILELRDQFDVPQSLSFPTNHITLLVMADRKGHDQIAAWVSPMKQRFGERIDIRGIADVSNVPGPLRGLVRKKFQQSQRYPVMMDWHGEACKAFTYERGQANVFVLDRSGEVLKRVNGSAQEVFVAEISALIEQRLAEDKSTSPHP